MVHTKLRLKPKVKKITFLVLLAIVAVGSYFISGTFAKYTSGISGYDDANVAKWSWTINDTVIDTYEKATASNAFTFDLFETVKDSDGTSTESDVESGYLAPGMTGAFEVELVNNSEVNATYTIEISETQTNKPAGVSRIPIEYSTDGGTTWSTTITSGNSSATNIAKGGGTATKAVKWRWVYTTGDEGDATDTQLGFAANTTRPNVRIIATIVVTQVD